MAESEGWRRLAVALALGAAQSASAADLVRGGELYRQHCSSCHGAQGVSTWPGAPSVARREGMLQPDRVLVQSIREGRNAMPGYRGLLSDADILSVVVYMRTLMR